MFENERLKNSPRYATTTPPAIGFTILGNPATKKNHSQMIKGRSLILPSKTYKQYEKSFKAQLATKRLVHFEKGVWITCKYYLKNKAHFPDLVGLMQATADLLSDEYAVIEHKRVLTKPWVLSDDSIIKSWDGTCIAGLDKENPRVEIWIEQLPDNANEFNPKILKAMGTEAE